MIWAAPKVILIEVKSLCPQEINCGLGILNRNFLD
jgi:hypothetical protein